MWSDYLVALLIKLHLSGKREVGILRTDRNYVANSMKSFAGIPLTKSTSSAF